MNSEEHAMEANIDVERWGWYSVAVSSVLITINFTVAACSGSLAVGSEAIHGVVDLLTAITVLAAIRVAARKSPRFPYGLYKLENAAAVLLAGMIFFTAYEIIRHAVWGPSHQTTVDWWMLGALMIAAVISLSFSHLELRAGRLANSPALIASAKEYRVHVLTSGIALSALFGQWLGLQLDRVAALVIVLPIVITGWGLLIEGARVLLDASLDAGTLDAIRKLARSDPMVVKVSSATGRSAGRFRFVEIKLIVYGNDFAKADQVSHRVERLIHENISNIKQVLVHVDPMPHEAVRCAVPMADNRGTISENLGDAQYFTIATLRRDTGQVEERVIAASPFQPGETSTGLRMAEWLLSQGVEMILLRHPLHHRGPAFVFIDSMMTLRQVKAISASEALSEIADQEQSKYHSEHAQCVERHTPCQPCNT